MPDTGDDKLMESTNNIVRTNNEVQEQLKMQLDLLRDYCDMFDSGKLQYVYPMSTVLRVLLKDTRNCHSLLGQLGLKDTLQFVDSAHHVRNGFCCWTIRDAHNLTALEGKVYAGLCAKTLVMNDDVVVVGFRPLFQHSNRPKEQLVNFDAWYDDIVLEDGTQKMSRKNVIENIAEKEGGCHLDKDITPEHATFREPESLKILINGEQVEFKPAPVYTSLRQIAWEVIETLK